MTKAIESKAPIGTWAQSLCNGAVEIFDYLYGAVKYSKPGSPRRHEAIGEVRAGAWDHAHRETLAEAKRIGEFAVLAPIIDAVYDAVESVLSATVGGTISSEQWGRADEQFIPAFNRLHNYVPMIREAVAAAETPAVKKKRAKRAKRRMKPPTSVQRQLAAHYQNTNDNQTETARCMSKTLGQRITQAMVRRAILCTNRYRADNPVPYLPPIILDRRRTVRAMRGRPIDPRAIDRGPRTDRGRRRD